MIDSESATAQRILDAAERLFVTQGVDATSLRAVTREAGVNVAAIHYHFGSRDALFRGVLDRTIRPLNRRRLDLLHAAVEAGGGGAVPIDDLLRAFLRPDVEAVEALRERGPEIARFIGRAYAAPTPLVTRFMDEQFAEVAKRFLPEFERSLPHVARDDLEFRLRCLVGVVVALFATAPEAGEEGPLHRAPAATTLERLVAFLEPGFAAPPVSPRQGLTGGWA